MKRYPDTAQLQRRTLLIGMAAMPSLIALPATAGDEALYDPTPPPDSCFFRVIRAEPSGSEISVGPATFGAGASISPYQVLKGGTYDVSGSGSVELAAGKYYSLAVIGEGDAKATTLLEDEILTDPAKCGIYLYNLSDAPSVTLTAPSANATVIDAIAPGANGFRPIKAPLTLGFEVMSGSEKLAAFDAVKIKRRSGVTFVAFGSGGAAEAIVAQNETASG